MYSTIITTCHHTRSTGAVEVNHKNNLIYTHICWSRLQEWFGAHLSVRNRWVGIFQPPRSFDPRGFGWTPPLNIWSFNGLCTTHKNGNRNTTKISATTSSILYGSFYDCMFVCSSPLVQCTLYLLLLSLSKLKWVRLREGELKSFKSLILWLTN